VNDRLAQLRVEDGRQRHDTRASSPWTLLGS
jgi:hypothetical protein